MGGLVGMASLSGDPVEESLFHAFLADHGSSPPRIMSRHDTPNGSFRAALVSGVHLDPPLQAQSARTRRLCAFFYGELFGDLKSAENIAAEVATGFEEYNGTFLARLNGSFLVMFHDAERRRITVAGDRTASLPLYYTQLGNILAFGFHLAAFCNLPGFRPVLCSEAVADFLGCGFLLENLTMIKDIRRLGPGQVLIVDDQEVITRSYWRYSFSINRRKDSREDLTRALGNLVQTAVRRRLNEDGIGIPLSGGYDSRSILGCVKKAQPELEVPTITWGVDENRPDSDAVIAAAIARHLKTPHVFFPLVPDELPVHFHDFVRLDEGLTDGVGNYPQGLYIFNQIRSRLNVNVLLRGDEVFGWKENISTIPELLHSLDIHELARLPGNYTYLQKRSRRTLEETGGEQMARILRQVPYDDLHDVKDHLYFNQRLAGYLQPLNQLKMHVLWIRNPYLDNDILDFIAHLPTEMRLGKNLFISAVRRTFPELDRFPIAERHNLIDWDSTLRRNPVLARFVRDGLLQEDDGFFDLVDRRRLEMYLVRAGQQELGATGGVLARAVRIPGKLTGMINRKRGYFRLDFSVEVFRLLILRAFIHEFLGGHCELG